MQSLPRFCLPNRYFDIFISPIGIVDKCRRNEISRDHSLLEQLPETLLRQSSGRRTPVKGEQLGGCSEEKYEEINTGKRGRAGAGQNRRMVFNWTRPQIFARPSSGSLGAMEPTLSTKRRRLTGPIDLFPRNAGKERGPTRPCGTVFARPE